MQQQVLMNSLMSWFQQHVQLSLWMKTPIFLSLNLLRFCGDWVRS